MNLPGASLASRVVTRLCLAALLACAVPALAGAAPEFQGRLTGIVIAPALREAIFIEDGATRRLHPGDAIDGWTIVTVEPDAVTLEADGARTRLSPVRGTAVAESPQTPPRPAPTVWRTHQVGDALARQQQQQDAAQASLAAATARMEAEQAAKRAKTVP